MSQILNVRMTLQDVLYISYAIQADSLRPILPYTVKLSTVECDKAFVSLVVLRSTRVRLTTLPFIQFDYYQFNFRTYVIDPISGQQAVYFIRSGVTSRFISIITRSVGIPWQLINLKVCLTSPKEMKYLSISGNWEGSFSIKAQAASRATLIPPLFKTTKAAVDFLIRPLIGLAIDKQQLSRFTIQHPEVQPETWSLTEMNCPLFQKLVAVNDYINPHSVFYLPMVDFSIFLPPTKIK